MTVDDLIRVLHAVPAEYRDGSVCIETDDSTRAVHLVLIDPLAFHGERRGVVFMLPKDSATARAAELVQVVRFAAAPPVVAPSCPRCHGIGRYVPKDSRRGETVWCDACIGTGVMLPEIPEVPDDAGGEGGGL